VRIFGQNRGGLVTGVRPVAPRADRRGDQFGRHVSLGLRLLKPVEQPTFLVDAGQRSSRIQAFDAVCPEFVAAMPTDCGPGSLLFVDLLRIGRVIDELVVRDFGLRLQLVQSLPVPKTYPWR
jgi:hypothetical protein